MRKMKHADNQINLCPILFPMSLFFVIPDLSKPMWLMLFWSTSWVKGQP